MIRTIPNTRIVEQLDPWNRGTGRLFLAPKALKPGGKGVLVPVGLVEMTATGTYKFAQDRLPPGSYPSNGKLVDYRA